MFFGFVILASLCICHFFLLCGYLYTFATTLSAIIEEFGSTMTAGSSARTAYTLVSSFMALIVGYIIAKKSARLCLIIGSVAGITTSVLLLFFTHSMGMYFFVMALPTAVMTSFGSGVAAQTIVSRWFKKKRSVCLAVLVSSGGVAGFVMPNFTAYVMERTGSWRAVWYYVLGGCIVCLLLSVFVLRDYPQQMGLYPDGIKPEKEESLEEIRLKSLEKPTWKRTAILKNPVFLAVLFAFAGSKFASNVVTGYTVAAFMDKGLPLAQASKVLSIYAFVNFFTRILSGVAMSKFGPKAVSVFALACVAASCLFAPFADTVFKAYLFASIYGFGFGFTTIGPSSIFLEAFGVREFSGFLSLETMIAGYLSAVLGLLPGIIRDSTGSFNAIFIFSGLFTAAGALVMIFLKYRKAETEKL